MVGMFFSTGSKINVGYTRKVTVHYCRTAVLYALSISYKLCQHKLFWGLFLQINKYFIMAIHDPSMLPGYQVHHVTDVT